MFCFFPIGLTLEQSTHLPTLMIELEKLEKQFRELTVSQQTRYTPVERKDRLKYQLSAKVTHLRLDHP